MSSRWETQTVYRLNRSCPIYPELRAIILKTSGLADELKAALEPLSGKILKAYVYGSIASGTDNSKSDVDLMVVGEVKSKEIESAILKVGQELGRVINPTVMRQDEYREKKRKKDSFVRQAEAGIIIELMGKKRRVEVAG